MVGNRYIDITPQHLVDLLDLPFHAPTTTLSGKINEWLFNRLEVLHLIHSV
ncbi:hypothetical protein Syun_025771 [Stephania yunnanensis]|uniref:Uncharacterized protein n=1 Tax=Stephania yunnanensis TaxID=152371 RepID=A0AAP0ET19_9MAGN